MTDETDRYRAHSAMERLVMKELGLMRMDVQSAMQKLAGGDEKFAQLQSEIIRLSTNLHNHVISADGWRERIMKAEYLLGDLSLERAEKTKRNSEIFTALIVKALPWLVIAALGGSHLLEGVRDARETEPSQNKEKLEDNYSGNRGSGGPLGVTGPVPTGQ